jgi:serine/threonine protein kinase
MALSPGTRLGPYAIVAPLGAGGMGEVYRAKDTRLDRTVAVKVLPEHVSDDAHLQQRFEREARALAGLSHPHICTLHDVGHEEGIRFLVMELLEGETLAERIEKGPLPVNRLLEVGMAIADALDTAHRQGILHRDVKPANIMLTKSGVKLLDFGLAKEPVRITEDPVTETSATATQQLPATAEGAVLGTLSYMAPEQLEGRETDSRSDLFALGAVLYEMATGTPAFGGNSQARSFAAILTAEPTPMITLRPTIPRTLGRAVDRCLAKDPEERWQSARDLTLELKWITEADSADDDSTRGATAHPWRERLAWILSLVMLAVALTLVAIRPDGSTPETHATRLSLDLPEGAVSAFTRISPDGRTLAISLFSDGRRQIWLRPLDALAAQPLPGTEDGRFPFWSPDSRHVGFFAAGKLKRIDVRGGPPVTLCDAPGPFLMGTWGRNGTILFSVTETPGKDGTYRVSDAGGTAVHITLQSESGNDLIAVSPSFLGDDHHFVTLCVETVDDKLANSGLCLGSLDSSQARFLMISSDLWSHAEYVPPGYLLYTRDGTLLAHAFDAEELRSQGEPIKIAERVEAYGPYGMGNFSASSNGILVYHTEGSRSKLTWKDRNGRTLGQVGSPGLYSDLTLGPHGERLAVTRQDLQTGLADIWIVELDRNVETRLTTESWDMTSALWSPDGSRIVFSATEDVPPFLHFKDLDGGEPEILLPSRGTLQLAYDWSQDGRHILYGQRDPNTSFDLWVLPLDGKREPVPFLQTPFKEMRAVFSPDGDWVAYASDESGRFEVYVRPFQGDGERRRVSTGGGYLPRWRRDGKELFYLTLDNRLMAVPGNWETGFEPGNPVALFSIDTGPNTRVPYDVAPDGQRFIVISAIPGEIAPPTVVVDWTAELPR